MTRTLNVFVTQAIGVSATVKDVLLTVSVSANVKSLTSHVTPCELVTVAVLASDMIMESPVGGNDDKRRYIVLPTPLANVLVMSAPCSYDTILTVLVPVACVPII